MRKEILDRYPRLPDGKLAIEIAAGGVEDLYSTWDRNAPYVRKELDPELAEYILDSVREVGEEPFVIQFRLATPADAEMASRIRASMANYFLYLRQRALREMADMMRTSSLLFVVGILILFLSVWVNEHNSFGESVVSKVFAQGLTVAAWVALWNALATFLVKWLPHRREMKVFQRIAGAEVQFPAATGE